ncbi:hypothetical protein FRC12_013265 [Ceratobasidium sp. 428]|nr:hypothetical protein FRC12_013265 [Ceratobasidium sp. 428]
MTSEKFANHALNGASFLKAQREHKLLGVGKILMDRYNPLHGLSVEDQRRATAKRVGLELPKDVEV